MALLTFVAAFLTLLVASAFLVYNLALQWIAHAAHGRGWACVASLSGLDDVSIEVS